MRKSKILIIQRRPGIGDMCAFLPFIRKIIEVKKKFSFYLLTNKRSRADQLLKYDGNIKNIFFYEDIEKIFKFIKFIKQHKFKEVYIYHYSLRLYLLCLFSGVKCIFIYGLIKKKNNNIITEAKNFTLKALNIKKNLTKFKCKINTFKKITKKKNKIIIGIGGSGDTKKWSVHNYYKLIKIICKNKKYSYLLAGGVEEKKDANYIIKNLKKVRIISLCNLSISDIIEQIQDSKLYIGNDTGFMHLSGSLGIKSFGLFGDTPPNYSDYNDRICPIIPNGYNEVGHDSLAMNKISVDQVYNKIKNFL